MQEQIRRTIGQVWGRHCAAFTDALAGSIDGLQNLLRLDEYHRHGHDPAELARGLGPLGASQLNLESLSQTLDRGVPARPMEPERLARVQALLPTLQEMKEVWASARVESAQATFDEDEREILRRAEAHFNRLAEVFRAIRVAQLEMRSKYDPSTHDPLFASFDWRRLGPGELQLSPPFLVTADVERGGRAILHKALGLLETGMPVKLLAVRASVGEDVERAAGRLPPAVTFETLPLAMRGVYLLQTSAAASDLPEQLLAALTAPRPSVISILGPRRDEDESAFRVRAERATRARALPVCTYDPDRAERFGLCLDVSANPFPSAAWEVVALEARDPDGTVTSIDEPFTFAHFAATEPDFQADFAEAPEAADDLVPLAEYLQLLRRQRIGKLPFILLVDENHGLTRKVVSERLALQCEERLRVWQMLQEISGADSPHVSRARADLEAQLADQRESQLQALRQQLETEAAARERAAVAATVRRLVARLTGVDPAS